MSSNGRDHSQFANNASRFDIHYYFQTLSNHLLTLDRKTVLQCNSCNCVKIFLK